MYTQLATMSYFLTRIHTIKHVNSFFLAILLIFWLVQVETPSVKFGVPLSHLRRCGQMRQGLPLVLTEMVQFLDKHGLLINGLFGVDGKVKQYQELKKSIHNGGFPEFDFKDVHPLASLLKFFLKALPGGLIPELHGKQLLQVFQDAKEEERNTSMRRILNTLPEEHLNVLSYLLFFLSRVATKSQQNILSTENLAMVFGPAIFRAPTVVDEQQQYNTLMLHLLDNITHLVPEMYPQPSASNDEEGVQHLLLTELKSKPPASGRLGQMKKRLRGFWRRFCYCINSSE
nr:protein FAM13A-like isoform X2 [Danio rerio]|eukprot:XP_021323911.1 protein FAM13A-like isoform X2 [Danio rerio]